MYSLIGNAALVGLLIMPLHLAAPANAQPVADFYKGKTISLVVASTPGGGYDAYARTLSRFYGAHIPGSPDVLVQNMPGGGSLTSVLYLDRTAPTDGTVLTIFNPGIMTESIINPSDSQVNFSHMAWIGSVTPDSRICYTWRSTGIVTWDDLAKKDHVTTFGATGQSSLSYNDTQMLRRVFNRNVRAILGYPGRSEVHLAIERGELDGECGSIAGLPDDWLHDGEINVPVRLVERAAPGVPTSAPYIGEFAKTSEERSILQALTAANPLGRPLIASKQVPDGRLAILRNAFDATMKDPAFLAASARQNLTVAPTPGDEAQRIIAKLYDVSPELALKASDAIR